MKLPVDTSAITFMCASGPEPVTDFETKQPKTDESGETLYSVQLVALSDGTAEIIAVKTAGKPSDSVRQGTNVKGVRARRLAVVHGRPKRGVIPRRPGRGVLHPSWVLRS